MRWTYRLGRLAGIDVYVHLTFLLLLGWIGLSRLFGGEGLLAAGLGVAFMAILFGIVVLHELGHALAARRYGIPTRDITLLPIGGVARLARMPEDPRQELVVALAGPAVNLVLAGVFALGVFGIAHLPATLPTVILYDLGYWLVVANLVLLGFNLLPAFPMDGGRVLRSFLARRQGLLRATETAVKVGRYVAALLFVAGIFYNPMLMLIALFVWFGGGTELAMVRQRAWMEGWSGTPGAPGTPGNPEVIMPPGHAGQGYVVMPGRGGWVAVRFFHPEPPPPQVRVVDIR